MAQTVDVLKYILDLDTKKFTASAKTADTQTKKLSKSIGTKLKGAIMGAVGAWSAYQALNITKELLLQGAAAERAAKSWENIAESFGLSASKMIEELREASAGTIADVDLMVAASRASIMGLTLKDLPLFVEIARSAARAFNSSTTQMFNDIVLGTARQSRLILDNLGIVLNLTDAYKKKADELGRELTEIEKKQALFNDVIAQGQNIIERVGISSIDTKDEIDRLAASWKNLTNEVGIFIAQSVTTGGGVGLFEGLTGSLKILNKFMADDTIPAWKRWGILLRSMSGDVEAFGKIWRSAFKKEDFIGPIDEAIKKTKELAFELKSVAGFLRLTPSEAKQKGFFPKPFQPSLVGATPGPSGSRVDMSGFLRAATDLEKAAPVIESAMRDIAFHINEAAQAFTEAAIRLTRGDVAGAVSVGLTAIIDAYASIYGGGESSVRNQVDALDKLTEAYERNIQAIEEMTIAERETNIQNILEQIANIERMISEGVAPRWLEAQQQTLRWYRDLLAEAEAIQGRFDDLRGVQNFEQAIAFLESLAEQGALGFQQGMNLVNFFTEMFDLTTEQQEELIQTLQDLLGDNLTADQWMQIQTAIERLQDEGVEVTAIAGPNQTLRSVTIITESQANLMLGVLNAINLEARKLVNMVNLILEELRSGIAGGGSVFHITINSNSASGQAIANALMVEVRGRGNKVSV